MTIKVSKPSINLREALSELKQDTGIKGQELMRADTVAEARSLIGAGRKNLIINGDMRISQRGDYTTTGLTYNSTKYHFAVDRWSLKPWGAYSEIATHTEVTLPNGMQTKALHVESLSAGSSFFHTYQPVETDLWMSEQEFTVSGWVRTNVPNQKLRACDGVDCHNVGEYIPNDGNWHYIVGQFTSGGTSGEKTWQIHPIFPDGTAVLKIGDYVEFTRFQLELGSVATDFEHRSFGEELALCQRYYEKSFPYATAPANGSNTTSFSTNAGKFITAHSNNSDKRDDYKFRVEKRSSPTMGIYGNSAGRWYSYSTGWHQNNHYVAADSTGFQSTQQATGSIVDVQGHWTADAEL
jgi:hypothetical protein